jgi:predicted nucleic acid-binding protein
MAIVALDSNVFIAALSTKELHSAVAQKLVRDIAKAVHSAVTSSLALGEVLTVSNASQDLNLETFFARITNLATIPANDAICLKAADLRRQYGTKLKLPDAIHLATALTSNADMFITNDVVLAKVGSKLIATKLLSDLSL